MKEWRFDQGRLLYFQIDEIKNIAKALSILDGTKKPNSDEEDTVRKILRRYTTLPFLPTDYTVWRNYGRVFECMLLATSNSDYIIATDLCKTIAGNTNSLDSDDYLAHFCRSFYYSSPIFQMFNANEEKVFPCIAIIKFLISEYITKGKDKVSIEEICLYLVGNNVTGCEPINFYSSLKPKKYHGDPRQIRELVRFISQLSFLKWENPNIYIEAKDIETLNSIETNLTPRIPFSNISDRTRAILEMGKSFSGNSLGKITISATPTEDIEFTEGERVRITHVRAERSSKLRLFYFQTISNPQICRMCDMDTAKYYPWTSHVIELHHLLPLSSPVRVESGKTSLKDIAGLCPSCHRATHKYYSNWFRQKKASDFESYQQAIDVFNAAKSQVKKHHV